MAQTSLVQATFRISEADLEFMVLDKEDIPVDFQDYQVVREGVLDNQMMAEHGFAGSTPEKFSQAGRITGFMREFGPTSDMLIHDGFNFVGATVAHHVSIGSPLAQTIGITGRPIATTVHQ